jgi:hypothetical protein
MDFFIINDAVIQKICILGDDVEPCFEGASVTAPNVSTNFTLDDNFKHTLYSMMQDLRKALNEGGQQMENLENTAVEVEQEAPVTDFEATEEVVSEAQTVETNDLEDTSVSVDFVKKDDEDKDQEEEKKEESSEDTSEEESSSDDKDDEDEKKAKKYSLLEDELNALKDKYSMLETQYQELLAFKTEIDNQQKDALIGEFYMLSDEDKADVIAHKTEYSLDDIKAKLSVICFDKKINFALNNDVEEKKEDIVTYTINSDENNSLPDWVKAVK